MIPDCTHSQTTLKMQQKSYQRKPGLDTLFSVFRTENEVWAVEMDAFGFGQRPCSKWRTNKQTGA